MNQTKTILVGGKERKILASVSQPFLPTIADIFSVPAALPTAPVAFVNFTYDQYKQTDCGPEAFQQLINFLYPGFIGSPEYTAKQTRLLDGFGPEDGTDFPHIIQSALNSGVAPLSLMADQSGSQTPEEYWSADGITPAIVSSAMPQKPSGWAQLARTPNWEELNILLGLNRPIMATIALGNRFYQDGEGNDTHDPSKLFPLNFGTLIGYHWIVLIPPSLYTKYGIVNPIPEMVYFKNAWGEVYGQNGVGWFNESYLQYILYIGTAF